MRLRKKRSILNETGAVFSYDEPDFGCCVIEMETKTRIQFIIINKKQSFIQCNVFQNVISVKYRHLNIHELSK